MVWASDGVLPPDDEVKAASTLLHVGTIVVGTGGAGAGGSLVVETEEWEITVARTVAGESVLAVVVDDAVGDVDDAVGDVDEVDEEVVDAPAEDPAELPEQADSIKTSTSIADPRLTATTGRRTVLVDRCTRVFDLALMSPPRSDREAPQSSDVGDPAVPGAGSSDRNGSTVDARGAPSATNPPWHRGIDHRSHLVQQWWISAVELHPSDRAASEPRSPREKCSRVGFEGVR
jgi:hypothetical protein